MNTALIAIGLAVLAPVVRHWGGAVGLLALAVAGTTPALTWTTAAPWPFLVAAIGVTALHAARERLGRAVPAAGLGVAAAAGATEGLRVPASVFDLFVTLSSSRGGVVFWNPALWLGLAGTALLARREPRLAAALGGGSLLLALGHAELALIPLAVPGMAVLLAAARDRTSRKPVEVLIVSGFLLSAWNLLFMEQYRRYWIPRDDTIAFPAVAENNARLITAAVGSPLAWPGNLWASGAYGLPLADFDRVVGHPAFHEGTAVLDLRDEGVTDRLLGDGWGALTPCGASACRALRERATVWLPLPAPASVEISLRAAGEGSLTLAVNGHAAGAVPLEPLVAELRLRTPATFWTRLNRVELTASAGAMVEQLTFRVLPQTAR